MIRAATIASLSATLVLTLPGTSFAAERVTCGADPRQPQSLRTLRTDVVAQYPTPSLELRSDAKVVEILELLPLQGSPVHVDFAALVRIERDGQARVELSTGRGDIALRQAPLKMLATVDAPESGARRLAYDGTRLLVLRDARTFDLWDLGTDRIVRTITAPPDRATRLLGARFEGARFVFDAVNSRGESRQLLWSEQQGWSFLTDIQGRQQSSLRFTGARWIWVEKTGVDHWLKTATESQRAQGQARLIRTLRTASTVTALSDGRFVWLEESHRQREGSIIDDPVIHAGALHWITEGPQGASAGRIDYPAWLISELRKGSKGATQHLRGPIALPGSRALFWSEDFGGLVTVDFATGSQAPLWEARAFFSHPCPFPRWAPEVTP